MATLLTVTCPKCNHRWQEDYERLQRDHRVVYRSAAPATPRREEYILRCPNPNHGEEIVITLQVEE